MSVMVELVHIQSKLKAPKNQRNNFGNYNYRSCEDILEAVKPILAEHKCALTISDEIVEVGGRIYVKATATIWHGDQSHCTTAFAREEESKKGMDASQLTGSTSSYARKYALNGLFCIDDTKDADTQDNTQHKTQKAQQTDDKPWFGESDFEQYKGWMIEQLQSGKTGKQLVAMWRQQYKVSRDMASSIEGLTA